MSKRFLWVLPILGSLVMSPNLIAQPEKSADTSPFITSRLKKALIYAGGRNPDRVAYAYAKKMGKDNGFEVDEGLEVDFTEENLKQYQLVLFLSNYDINFNATQQADYQKWSSLGNGTVCIHACGQKHIHLAWPWYGAAMGAFTNGHTPIKPGTVHVDAEAASHPIFKGLTAPKSMTWTDEWNTMNLNPRGQPGVTMLLTVDPKAWNKSTGEYPHAWVKEVEGSRMFRWAGMHTQAAFEIPFMNEFLLSGFRYVAGYDTLRTGCMDPASSKHNPYATSQPPGACETPSSIKPVNGFLDNKVRLAGRRLSINLEGTYSLRITDAQGKSIHQAVPMGNSTYLVPQNVTSGLVYLQILVDNKLYVKKLALL